MSVTLLLLFCFLVTSNARRTPPPPPGADCFRDNVAPIFVQEEEEEQAVNDTGFPPGSKITVRCRRDQDIHCQLVCGDNATWVIEQESGDDCGQLPPTETPELPEATRSWIATHRMASLILCVGLVILLMVLTLGSKIVSDKYGMVKQRRRLRRRRQRAASAAAAAACRVYLTQLREEPGMERREITTVSGRLVIDRTATLPVHIVVTTFLGGPFPDDAAPAYDEVMALEEPPPSYEDAIAVP